MKVKATGKLTGFYDKSLVAYLLILTILLLWPFDFVFLGEKNNVSWIGTSNGIEFFKKGQVLSVSSTENLYSRLVAGNGLSIEVWVAAQNEVQSGPARIVSYSLDTGLRNFTLGQSQKKLVMRLRTTETDRNGVIPHLEVDGVFGSPYPQHIVVTYDFFEESVYINAERRVRKRIPGGRFTNWDPSYYLVFGNEATGHRPWLGKILFAAIYDCALDEHHVRRNYEAGWLSESSDGQGIRPVSDGLVARYLFDERRGNKVGDSSGTQTPLDLEVPQVIKYHNRPYLALSSESLYQNPNLCRDTILNIIAFIPLGFLFHAALRTRWGSSLKTSAFVFLLGTLFTFCIETSQHFTLTRYSSILDVFSNMLGTAIGIATDKSYIRYLEYRGKLVHRNG